jgi:hypothetical protein
MSETGNKGLFFRNAVYRRNRLIDAVRLLPVLGTILFLMPAFLAGGSAATARQWLYLFGAWIVMIIVAALMARALRKNEAEVEAED